VTRPDLPPWLYPPPRMPRFQFNSGPVAFGAGVEAFLGRIRPAPGLWLRLAAFAMSGFSASADNRLRIAGAGCASWFNVPLINPINGTMEFPFFLVLPQDSEAEVYFTRAAATTEIVRLTGWHFAPDR